MPECYNRPIVPGQPYARSDDMRMTPPTFGDDADAARHLVRHLTKFQRYVQAAGFFRGHSHIFYYLLLEARLLHNYGVPARR